MKHNNKTRLLNEADDLTGMGGGGVATQEPPVTPPAAPQEPVAPASPTVPAQPAAVQLTQEQLKQLVQGIKPEAAPAKTEPAPMSREEQRKLLKHFGVTPDYVKQVFGADSTPEQRATLLQQLVDGAAEHAYTVSQLAFQKELAKMREEFTGEFAPVREHFQAQRAAEAEKGFYTKYPHLEQYKQAVNMVASSINKDLVKGKSGDEIAELVASQTINTLKQLNITVDSTGQAQPTTPSVPKSQPSVVGGRSQTTPPPAGGSSKSDEAAWLDRFS